MTAPAGARVLRAFLGRQTVIATRQEYRRDLRSLGWALGLTDLEATVAAVCRDRGAHVEELAARWRLWLRSEGASLATVKRRFGTLRGLLAVAVELGAVEAATPLPAKRL